MFSGAGVVARGTHASSMRCRKRLTGLGSSATHTQIFYNLGVGRVHFDANTSQLYFVDCNDPSISQLLAPVFQGMNSKPEFEQLFLDNHGLMKGAIRLTLQPPQIAPALAALRLNGIDISIAGA